MSNASEKVALLGSVDPVSLGAASSSSGWISAANFHAFMAVLMIGAIGVSASVTFIVEQASDSGGTGVKAVTGAAITALTGIGADGAKQAIIDFRQEDLDLANDFNHFRVTITNADDGASPTGVASLVAAAVFGVDPRTSPASDNDASTVDEIVTV